MLIVRDLFEGTALLPLTILMSAPHQLPERVPNRKDCLVHEWGLQALSFGSRCLEQNPTGCSTSLTSRPKYPFSPMVAFHGQLKKLLIFGGKQTQQEIEFRSSLQVSRLDSTCSDTRYWKFSTHTLSSDPQKEPTSDFSSFRAGRCFCWALST